MNSFKKILVAFLIICMIVPSVTFGADGELFVPECSREAEALVAVGVLEGTDDELLSQEVTRGLAAHYITKLMGISAGAVAGKYTDVTADTPYAAEIEMLTDLDIVHGTGAGLFEPDRPMLMQEFVKMLISTIGYSIPANEQGGYPTGYMRYASELDILDGLESQPMGEAFSVAAMAVMLYNSLDAEVMTIDSYTEGSIKLDIVDGSSVLSAFLHLEIGEGQVKSTEQGSLTSSEAQAEGMVLIDGETYYTGDVDVLPYLGYKLDFYYKKDGARKTLVYAAPSDDNKVLVIDADDIDAYKDMAITYTDDSGDTETTRLTATTDVVYNYRPVSPVTEADIEISNGTVTVIDCDGNGKNDAVIVRSYRTVYARSIDYSGKIIYDEYNAAQPLNLGAAGINLVIYDRKGNKASLDAVEYDSLLSCVISRDGSYVEITEIVDEVIGKVESIETENGNTTYIVIGKKRYGICPELEAYGLNFDVGDKIICYLDANGDIGVVRDDMVTREKWGFFETAASTSGLDTFTKVRIMQEGESGLKVYPCAKRIEVDGTPYTSASAQKAALDTIQKNVVRYALNANGELAYIKTKSGGFVAAYEYVDTESTIWWDGSINIFGGKIGAALDTPVFLIPSNGDASKYVSSTVDKTFAHYVSYSINIYKLSEQRLTADVILMKVATAAGESVKQKSPFMMVEGVRAVKTQSGDTVKQLYGYVNGNEAAYIIESDTLVESVKAYKGTVNKVAQLEGSYSLRCGDLIQFELDASDIIIDTRLMMRSAKVNSGDTEFNIFGRSVDYDSSGTNYNSQERVIKGWVYQKDGTLFNVSTTKPTSSTNMSTADIYPLISDIGVYIYHPTRNEIELAGPDDLLPYTDVGDGCSEIVVFFNGGDMQAVVLKGK